MDEKEGAGWQRRVTHPKDPLPPGQGLFISLSLWKERTLDAPAQQV